MVGFIPFFHAILILLLIIIIIYELVRQAQNTAKTPPSLRVTLGTTTTSEKNPLPFNVPVIMVSPPTIRSRLRASIVSLGYTSTNRRRSTASSTSGVTRPPSAVVAATRETSFSIHRSQRTPSTLSYNNSAQDDEKPLASLHRSLS
ncbi:hypothetical protein BDF22DRAFT_655369 [Syncephalis plumigaleata]|nr:hypothetical protein BDF22DRAFT_655369 [Syncephalis plumigaleata]